jgi:hypothetical protein
LGRVLADRRGNRDTIVAGPSLGGRRADAEPGHKVIAREWVTYDQACPG